VAAGACAWEWRGAEAAVTAVAAAACWATRFGLGRSYCLLLGRTDFRSRSLPCRASDSIRGRSVACSGCRIAFA